MTANALPSPAAVEATVAHVADIIARNVSLDHGQFRASTFDAARALIGDATGIALVAGDNNTTVVAGTEVTARDRQTGQSDTVVITDDYVVIAEGRAKVTNTQVHRRAGGAWTHVLTVKCDPPSGGEPS